MEIFKIGKEYISATPHPLKDDTYIIEKGSCCLTDMKLVGLMTTEEAKDYIQKKDNLAK